MKWTLASLALAVAALTLSSGCNNSSKPDNQTASLTPAVTDITPAAAPVAAQPVIAEQPAAPAAAAQQAAAGSRYTVKKGDTLWKIAAAQYGNGNQWQRIASANPGLTAESLKAGQTIVLP